MVAGLRARWGPLLLDVHGARFDRVRPWMSMRCPAHWCTAPPRRAPRTGAPPRPAACVLRAIARGEEGPLSIIANVDGAATQPRGSRLNANGGASIAQSKCLLLPLFND